MLVPLLGKPEHGKDVGIILIAENYVDLHGVVFLCLDISTDIALISGAFILIAALRIAPTANNEQRSSADRADKNDCNHISSE